MQEMFAHIHEGLSSLRGLYLNFTSLTQSSAACCSPCIHNKTSNKYTHWLSVSRVRHSPSPQKQALRCSRFSFTLTHELLSPLGGSMGSLWQSSVVHVSTFNDKKWWIEKMITNSRMGTLWVIWSRICCKHLMGLGFSQNRLSGIV